MSELDSTRLSVSKINYDSDRVSYVIGVKKYSKHEISVVVRIIVFSKHQIINDAKNQIKCIS